MPIECADGAQRSLAAHDASVFDGGVAGPVCFPETTEEVQAIMRIAEQHGSAVVPVAQAPASPVARSRWGGPSWCRPAG